LWHWAIGCGHNQNRPIHLGGAGNHVFDVVSMTRAVYVSIVTLFSFVLDMGDGDGNAALSLFGGLINLIKCDVICQLALCQHPGNCACQRRLAMVDMPDGADIDMRFRPDKPLLRHTTLLLR
jgi:hypothetical protein